MAGLVSESGTCERELTSILLTTWHYTLLILYLITGYLCIKDHHIYLNTAYLTKLKNIIVKLPLAMNIKYDLDHEQAKM